MAENVCSVGFRVAHLTSFTFVSVLLLLWSTAAYAQSREDQYGSPTDSVDHVSQAASGTLSVLPDTGGPLILFIGVAFIVAGGRVGHRWSSRRGPVEPRRGP
jgi:hypothetical protein